MKNLFIISGGPGKEHEISVFSGKNVSSILHESHVPHALVYIDKQSKWHYEGALMSEEEGLGLLKRHNALVFQLIHGTFGEDGFFCKLLEEKGISYIGSDAKTMELTIDKYKVEQLLQKFKMKTTHSVLVQAHTAHLKEMKTFPLFIKPVSQGSSVGLYKVENKDELQKAVKEALLTHGPLLVQEYIAGREFTCGVLEIKGEIVALTPSEVVLTRGTVFDYDAKYSPGGAKEITPAEADQITLERVRNLAQQVHMLCGCKDFSRTDMIMKENGELVVLEINTIPGMTSMSFMPVQMEVSGYTLVRFIEGMLQKYS